MLIFPFREPDEHRPNPMQQREDDYTTYANAALRSFCITLASIIVISFILSSLFSA
ncbi:hypothetical protein GCM10007094_37260 [Pseudovibrio japonicus]|uniref:Aa3-type cytochrome c oxidase subunit IV n=1 Tax=Pseudovibrio japonicus TaxID=366534 RepID=A0ABQ3EPH7_9HYPH|nr:hypothetical protein [Pseudovibrio japonicus]GHB44476.1 hypothetical protein GCM10007094_37260 [Pseudovibrio japonicus]